MRSCWIFRKGRSKLREGESKRKASKNAVQPKKKHTLSNITAFSELLTRAVLWAKALLPGAIKKKPSRITNAEMSQCRVSDQGSWLQLIVVINVIMIKTLIQSGSQTCRHIHQILLSKSAETIMSNEHWEISPLIFFRPTYIFTSVSPQWLLADTAVEQNTFLPVGPGDIKGLQKGEAAQS